MNQTSFLHKYVNQHWHVAICTMALAIFLTIDHPPTNDYFILLFLGTWIFYEYCNQGLPQNWKSWEQRFLLYSCVVVGLILYHWQWRVSLFFLITCLPAFLYSLPGTLKGIREIPGLKIFFIAAYWLYLTLIFPKTCLIKIPIPLGQWLAVLLFLIGIIIPFDIKDSEKDSKKLKTFPQILGIPGATLLSVSLVVLSGILGYFFFQTNDQQWAWSLSAAITSGLILRRNPSDFHIKFWIEASSLWPLLFWFIIQWI